MEPAQRIKNLPPYLFADVDRRIAEKRAKGFDVISLGIGDPDLPTPAYVVDALYKAAQTPANHRYPDYYGLPELRQSIAGWYDKRFGVKLDPNKEVVPLIGSKEGIANIAYAYVDPGDTVLVPDPGYPVYSIGTLLANGTSHFMPLKAENGFLPDLKAVPEDVARKAKILWINYPNNPTSATAPTSFFDGVVAYAKKYDLLVCHDNAYSEVTYDGYTPISFLQAPGARDVSIEFHSLSKTYNMTGWRIGMCVGNAAAIEALGRVKTNVDSGIFQAVQYAGIAALEGPQDWLAERNTVYQKRRDAIIAALSGLGMEIQKPKASLYVWAKLPAGETSSISFSLRMLEDIAVFVTPGVGFGAAGEGYIRVSVTTPDHRLNEALDRITKWKR